MGLDFERLAREVAAARKARGLRQEDLAAAASIGVGSVQNVEGARPFRREPPSLRKIERALGWAPGSCMAILNGGEPTLTSGTVHTRAPGVEPDTDGAEGMRGLPAGIRAALSEGEHLAGDVIDLSEPGSGFRLIVVAQRGLYETDEDIESLRKQMKEWMRIQAGIRDLVRPEGTGEREDGKP